MNDGTADELRVAFPATTTFVRIGRVTIAGLALRLGIDISMVERLRMAVDAGVNALVGAGRIEIHARWQPGHLVIVLANPNAGIDNTSELADQISALVAGTDTEQRGSVRVDADHVQLELSDAPTD